MQDMESGKLAAGKRKKLLSLFKLMAINLFLHVILMAII